MERVFRVLSLLSLAVLSLAVLIAPDFARAQTAGDASVVGVVSDASGAVLPGATVTVTSLTATEPPRTTVTDSGGRYTILALRPGTYTVRISLTGFQSAVHQGVALTANFTATLNDRLQVGSVQQEVSVTAASAPMVDTQTLTQQATVSRQQLAAVPTSQSALGITALIASAVVPPNAEDVGGTKGETSVRISVHGTKPTDARLLQEGMPYNALTPAGSTTINGVLTSSLGQSGLEGTGRGYYVDPLAVSEVDIDTGTMGSAQYGVGGAQSNAIYKDGTDKFHASMFGAWTNHELQSGNLTAGLQQQGLATANGNRFVYDGDAFVSGPVKKGRVWFLVHARGWGTATRVGGLYLDANESKRVVGAPAADWLYAPSPGQPVNQVERDKAIGLRITGMLTSKDRGTFSYDKQINFQDSLSGTLLLATAKLEGNGAYCQNEAVWQGTWTRTQSSRLLFQGGVTVANFDFGSWATKLDLSDFAQCGREPYYNVFISDVGLGYTYNGGGAKAADLSHQSNGRFTTDIVTGRHDFKVGTDWMYSLGGYRTNTVYGPSQIGGLPVSYTFVDGNPTGLTQYASPILAKINLAPSLGIYGQDQWRISSRLTASAGLRFDWVRESVPPVCEQAGLLTAARCFSSLDNVPNWKDLNPRFGVVWDPWGDAKTAIKAGINRYIMSETTGIANDLSPATATVSSTTRSWKDLNHNFLPDCNLANPLANGECGADANQSFGQTVITQHADPKWVTGWGKRPYGWHLAVSAQREIKPGLTASVGYYRAWYANQIVVNNLDTPPADFSPYCVPVPNDARLPKYVAGKQLCGLYDLNPAQFGQVNNFVTFGKNYGHPTDIYNGVDILFQVRRGRLTTAGGLNIGDSMQTATTAAGSEQAASNNCFVYSNPQTLFHCAITPPYQTRLRLNGSYDVPWHEVVVAAVFQTNPGPVYSSNITYPTATIAQSLGRPISGGTASETIEVDNPFSQFGPRINQLDLRASKTLNVWRERKAQFNFDLYNSLNSSAVVNYFSTYGTYGSATAGSKYLAPTEILDGRLAKFSVQFDF